MATRIDRTPEPGQLSLKQAIFLVEHPSAVARDFPGREEPVWARVDALIERARQERPLEWQAYEARCAERQRHDAQALSRPHERILTFLAAGGTVPEVPPLPSG